MADIDRLLKVTRKLEGALRRRGAQGRGLHSLVSSIESDLPADLVKQLRWLATLRNKAVHEEGFRLTDMAAIDQAAHQALRRLEASPLSGLLSVALSPRATHLVWLGGVVAAGAATLLWAPAKLSPTACAVAASAMAAWLLHPVRQPKTLAVLLACSALGAAGHLLF